MDDLGELAAHLRDGGDMPVCPRHGPLEACSISEDGEWLGYFLNCVECTYGRMFHGEPEVVTRIPISEEEARVLAPGLFDFEPEEPPA